jgi:signal transduction histidine kinase
VEASRVAAIYGRLPLSQATVLVNGAIVTAVLGGAAGWGRLLGWLAALWGVVLLRLAWWWRRRARPHGARPDVWSRRFVAGALLNGLCWGVLLLLVQARVGTPGRLFAAAVVVGMVSGAASSAAGHLAGFTAFAAPSLLPVISWSVAGGNALEHATGALACGFAAAMWTLVRGGDRALTESLTLQLRNESLVSQLQAARERLTAANAELEQRIRERTAELVELERQLSRSALLASLGSLSAAIAHDLNSPIASLLGNLGVIEQELAEAAEAGAATPVSREALEDVRACANRVRTIVRSLGDVARGDGQTGPLALEDVLDACVTVATPELRAHARVVRDYAHPFTVRGDRASLTQAILALLLRVGRATDGGGLAREVRIGARTGAEPGTVVVEFVREERAASSSDDAHLDRPQDFPLSLTHAAVARLGGRVTSIAEDGRVGFALTLPLEDAAEGPRPAGAPG